MVEFYQRNPLRQGEIILAGRALRPSGGWPVSLKVFGYETVGAKSGMERKRAYGVFRKPWSFWLSTLEVI
jgi:hypothetical protein